MTDTANVGMEAGDAGILSALADRQWSDYRARQPGTCFADPDFTLNVRQAYELQNAVAALRVAAGDRIIGYKVGCTGPGTVAQFGMAGPIRGFLFASEVRQSGATLDVAEFAHLAIEGEIALRIGGDGEIAAVLPVIELHHYLFRAPRRTLAELIANNGFNAGIVLPEDRWVALRPDQVNGASLSVRVDDRRFGPSELWPLPGGAMASLDWLRRHLSEFGLDLAPGQIVLAGTPLGLYPVGRGGNVEVLLDGARAVQCSIA